MPGDPDVSPDDYPGLGHPQLTSEQFVVSDNPVVGVLYGPGGDVLATYYERDDRFGFLKWAEDR